MKGYVSLQYACFRGKWNIEYECECEYVGVRRRGESRSKARKSLWKWLVGVASGLCPTASLEDSVSTHSRRWLTSAGIVGSSTGSGLGHERSYQ